MKFRQLCALASCVFLTAHAQVRESGFTVTPPQHDGWYVERSREGVAFERLLSIGPSRDRATAEPQTFAILVVRQRVRADAIASPEALESFARQQVVQADPRRNQKLVASKLERFTTQGTDCVRYEATFEEQPRKFVLVITGAGMMCRHPGATDLVVHASWSERHARDSEAAPIDAYVLEAQKVLDSIAFTPLP